MVKNEIEFYVNPNAMEPLFPDDPSGKLEELAMELIAKGSRLSGALNPITREAIADFLRPMNSYYSNLIEGHDTHPLDISRALDEDYSDIKAKRDLQLEAKAHIKVHKILSDKIKIGQNEIPSSSDFLKEIHRVFYEFLPEDFKFVTSKEGMVKEVIPGEFRVSEVEVGRHVAPFSGSLPSFMNRFSEFYNPRSNANKSKIRRIISIAASHHRLAWIHPFLDGNGRVVRLYSDASFMDEDLHASGLWSISRGLARTNSDYKAKLANADLTRYNDYDGRGNLSNKQLVEFCKYFLETAIDQIDYMSSVVDIETMLKRIEGFSDLMLLKGKFTGGMKYLLTEVFLKGKISKAEAMRITNTSDKTLKKMIDSLIEMKLLTARKESITMMYYVKYPISFSPMIFPGLYPADKEVDMINEI